MTENARTEPEAIEMSYATVSSTPDYTIEQTVIEIETSLDMASYGVHHTLDLNVQLFQFELISKNFEWTPQ